MSKNKLLLGALVGACSLGAVVNLSAYAQEDKEQESLLNEEVENEVNAVENSEENADTEESETNEKQDNENIEEITESKVEEKKKSVAKQGRSLQDITVNRDKSLPIEVGINAKKTNVGSREFPLLPGFSDTQNGIIGKVPNGESTTIEMYKTELTINGKDVEYYVVKTSSNITSDKMVQSYIKQILSFYEGKEYSVDIGGIEATIMIKK